MSHRNWRFDSETPSPSPSVVSFIDKYGEARARGHEKTLEPAEKSYGHKYLIGSSMLIVRVAKVVLFEDELEHHFSQNVEKFEADDAVATSTRCVNL